MTKMFARFFIGLSVIFLIGSAVANPAHDVFSVWPEDVKPQLSHSGTLPVGVKTMKISSQGTDFTSLQAASRELTLEVWYPAASSSSGHATYSDVLRSGKPFTVKGTAFRDAAIAKSDTAFPVVVLSHGYTGYRSLMFYLGEHLASHGYVVAGIDHTDSTNADVVGLDNPFTGFPSTLLNRALDQLGTLDALADSAFFSASINAENAGIIGFSMGGYGALNSAGTCYGFSPQSAAQFTGSQDTTRIAAVQRALNTCSDDARVKAIVALAPWGAQHNLFESKSVASVTTPTLFVSGSEDDVSIYPAIHELFKAWGAPHTYMLTLDNARHNIGGHPAPPEAFATGHDVTHYIDGTWDTQRINEIVKHFSLAMMDCHVKGNAEQCAFLSPGEDWHGFDDRFATGLLWEQKTIAK